MIPAWTPEGRLPPGVFSATWNEVTDRLAWNSHRRSLLLGLGSALASLQQAGCSRLWLDGSFVTNKEFPGDYDCCWAHEGVDPLFLDQVLLDLTEAGRRTIKSKYLGDVLIAGVETGSGLPFVEFFQQTRDGIPKGIILLNPQETR